MMQILSDWPVGLSTGCFYQTNILECLEHIRAAGFSLIEVCSFPAHLDYHDSNAVSRAAELIDRLGLVPYSFHAPFADHIDITSLDDGVRAAAVNEVVRAAEAAAQLGVQNFVIHPGPEKSELPEAQRLHRMQHAADSLNVLSLRCRELGVRLVLENMLPHLFFGKARDVLWILGAIDTVDVGICLDTGHAHLSGDLSTVIHKLSGHLWMVHASDNRGQRDDHLPPGEGHIPWQQVVRQLADLRFNGTLILEIAGFPTIGETLERARRASRFLRDLARLCSLDSLPDVPPSPTAETT